MACHNASPSSAVASGNVNEGGLGGVVSDDGCHELWPAQ